MFNIKYWQRGVSMSKEKLVINPKPPKGEDGHRTFSVRISNELVQELDALAAKSGHSRNQIISMFIEYGLRNCEISDQ